MAAGNDEEQTAVEGKDSIQGNPIILRLEDHNV